MNGGTEGRYRMKKKAKKADTSAVESGFDVVSVHIGTEDPVVYRGLGGTFASFADSCLRKRVLPGFHQKGLIAEAEPKESGLVLCLSGKRSEKRLREIMDIALVNTGAYPSRGGKAGFSINVTSKMQDVKRRKSWL
jgi:hypothetical protein